MPGDDHLQKWRLILGGRADPEGEHALEGHLQGVDRVLEALYDSEKKAGLGRSSPNVNRWLGDIRRYFPSPVVQLMQKDALERLQLEQLLLEPELLAAVEADVHLVGLLLSLNKVMPDRTRETARQVVRRIVEQLERRLAHQLQEAVRGALYRAVRKRRPRPNEIDWGQTVRANLRHYQRDLGTIIPQQFIGYGRKGRQLRHIILLVDQSGSMASSVVYAGVMGCILASLRSVETRVVAFDTSVIDLSEHLHDPVELLFGTQLGGGTDIQNALSYARKLIQVPSDTIMVLISDLFEGGRPGEMIRRVADIQSSGVRFISLLALNDEGAPAYDKVMATQLAALDIPTFACTPDQFPGLMASAIKKEDIRQWMAREGIPTRNG